MKRRKRIVRGPIPSEFLTEPVTNELITRAYEWFRSKTEYRKRHRPGTIKNLYYLMGNFLSRRMTNEGIYYFKSFIFLDQNIIRFHYEPNFMSEERLHVQFKVEQTINEALDELSEDLHNWIDYMADGESYILEADFKLRESIIEHRFDILECNYGRPFKSFTDSMYRQIARGWGVSVDSITTPLIRPNREVKTMMLDDMEQAADKSHYLRYKNDLMFTTNKL